MKYEPITVSIREIESSDNFYKVSDERDSAILEESIKSIGLTNPLILEDTGHSLRIVSGFRRLAALTAMHSTGSLPLDNIPCLKVSGKSFDHALIAVSDNSMSRELTLSEKVRSIKLLDIFSEDAKATATLARSAGIECSPVFAEKLLTLASADESILTATSSGIITMQTALELAAMPEDEADAFSSLFVMLRPGNNKQREILVFTKEIAAREDRTPIEVLHFPEIEKILQSDEQDNNRKTSLLRSFLRRRRYPAIVKKEEEFNLAVKGLGLANGVSVFPPKNFEDNRFSIRLEFSDKLTLNKQIGKLAQAIEDGQADDIFK